MRRSILVGVSPATDGDAAVDWAADEAERRQLPLHLVHSLEWFLRDAAGAPERLREEGVEQGRQLLRRAAGRVAARSPGTQVQTSLDADADPSTALLTRAGAAEMVVVGSKHRTTLGDLVAASCTTATLHDADCPVVVVGGPPPRQSGPVVVGVDGSGLSDRAVQAAFAEADARGTLLRALLVWHQPTLWSAELAVYGLLTDEQQREAEQGYAEALARALERGRAEHPDVHVEQQVVEGHAGSVLVEASRDASLLVVGSRGRGGFAGLLLGSVSAAVVHHAHCPVMVCHRPRRVSAA